MTTTEKNTRIEHATTLLLGLLDVVGGPKAGALAFDLGTLEVLYELSDAEQAAIEAFITRCKALEASYLSAAQVAEELRISTRLAQRLFQSGALRAVQRRGKWITTPAALQRFIKANTYQNGVRVQLPPGPADDVPDAQLLERARAEVEKLPWRIADLASTLGLSYDRTYRLALAWCSVGAVERVKRGSYRFV